jgi:hypothetical protein
MGNYSSVERSMNKLFVTLILAVLFFPSTAFSKNLWQRGESSHVELEYRQGQTLGQTSSFTGFNMLFSHGWVRGGTVSISFMNNDVERNKGGTYESVKNLVYGGARFKLDHRFNSQLRGEVYAVVGVGSVDYQQIKTNSSSSESGMFAAIQPGVRLYLKFNKMLSIGSGISAFSGSVGNGLDGGPYGDVAVRLGW